jgi:hypothetical protein
LSTHDASQSGEGLARVQPQILKDCQSRPHRLQYFLPEPKTGLALNTMKKIIAALLATAFMASFVMTVSAEEVTIKGQAVCTKCEMHETDKCSTAIRAKEDGKDVVYYAVNNDVAKTFHKTICQAPSQVVATGKVKDKDGKKMITLSKIELAP